jgi:hypothetical protein
MVPAQDELERAHCWERDDRVAGRPEMTEFRRRLRLHQARWREAHGHPIGTQPIVPRPDGQPARQVGSRLPLAYAQETGANFLTPTALDAARSRAVRVERHQTFDHQRLWADLLWSPSMAFNLFGDAAADLDVGNHAVRTWWPDAPGAVCDVRFAHSPGRFDPHYMNSLRSFDAVVVLEIDGGSRGVIGVDVKYHEWAKPEIPRPANMRRYLEVAEQSTVFRAGVLEGLGGRWDLTVMWLEHLLLLSMLQHHSGEWTWGRYVVVHPAGNTDFADACARYRELLADPSTFSSITTEELLDAGALPKQTTEALRERYVAD